MIRAGLVLIAASLAIAPQASASPLHSEWFTVRTVVDRTLKPRTDCNLVVDRAVVHRGTRRLGYMDGEPVGECGARLHGFGVALVLRVHRHRLRVIVANANLTPRRVQFDWHP